MNAWLITWCMLEAALLTALIRCALPKRYLRSSGINE
jgi:hypothetical protein